MNTKIFLATFSFLLCWASFTYSSDTIKEAEQEFPKNPAALATPTNKSDWETRKRDPRYNKLKRHSPREGQEVQTLMRKLSLPAPAAPIQTKQLSLTPRAKSDTVSGRMDHPIIIKSTSDLDLRRALSRKSSSQPNTPRAPDTPSDQRASDDEDADPQ